MKGDIQIIDQSYICIDGIEAIDILSDTEIQIQFKSGIINRYRGLNTSNVKRIKQVCMRNGFLQLRKSC